MLKKILLTLDGSENAEKALPWAKQFAAREKALVVLFRVVAPTRDRSTWRQDRQEAREYLLRIEKELNYSGIPTKILVRRGHPAREIVDAAMDQGCDLIVISSRGGSPVKRWMMGGVTEQVLRWSSVPVLPVWTHMNQPRQRHVSRILVPLDGSKRAESVVGWAIRLSRLLRSKLVFLHVHSGGRGISKGAQALRNRMSRLSESLGKQGVRAEFRLQKGDPADRILVFADRNDLVLTTTHGYGGMKRWVFGSVAEKLVHAGTVPILVYKTFP